MASTAPVELTIGSDRVSAGLPSRLLNIYLTTFLGLALGFGTIFIPAPAFFYSICDAAGLSHVGAWRLEEIVQRTFAACSIVAVALLLERAPLSSIGLRKPRLSDLGLGIALFVIVTAVDIGLGMMLRRVFPGMRHLAERQYGVMLRTPIAFAMAVAMANGITEELIARGFAIPRLGKITGSLTMGCLIALAVDLAVHIPFWGWRYAIVITPAETLLMLMYLWRGDICASAIAHIACDAAPFFIPGIWALSMSFLGHGNYNHLMAGYDYEYRNYEAAIAEATRGLRIRPRDAQLLLDRARAEIGNHEYAAAIDDLDASIGAKPQDPDYEPYLDRAMAYANMSNYEAALEDANRAVALAPKNGLAYKTRAWIYGVQQNYDAEEADLTAAITLGGDDLADLYGSRAGARVAKGELDLAIADLTHAAALSPGDASILEQLSAAHAANSQKQLAIEDLTRAIEAEPGDASLYRTRAEFYFENCRYQLAVADLRKTVALDPSDDQAANSMAWMLSTAPDDRVRDGRLALKMANTACDLSSWKDGAELDTLAAAYAEIGNFIEAAKWQQRAFALMKSSSKEEQEKAADRLQLYQQNKPYRDVCHAK